MSSLCRKAGVRAALLAMAWIPGAWAQQKYFIPGAELTGEHYTNRELRSDSNEADPTTAYKGTVEARIGRATPRSDMELHPRITFQEFPDREGVDPLELLLDLNTQYRMRTGEIALIGRYSRQDTINAEFGEARFDDDLDPTTPPTDVDTGVVFAGQTRERFSVEPSFQFSLTERTGLEGAFRYDSARYDSNQLGTRVGYDSPYAELVITHTLGPRTNFGIGPYVARYEPDTNTRRTDTTGARIGVEHRWTERSRVGALLRVERNEDTLFGPPDVEASSTEWGIELLGERSNQVGKLRYSIGRFLNPSSLGSRRQNDQIRLQYDRPLSERVNFKSALRLQRDQQVGGDDGADNRDRARFELSLSRRLTLRWTLTGGYRYAWQDLGETLDQADNHSAFLTIGFKGLDPRRGNQ